MGESGRRNFFKTVSLATVPLLSLIAFSATGKPQVDDPRQSVTEEWDRHFNEMETIIANEGFLYRPKMLSRLKDIDPDLAERGIGNDHIESAMDQQAFYHKTDKDPLDIVLRRTKALLAYLSDLEEWTAGTDANDADSSFEVNMDGSRSLSWPSSIFFVARATARAAAKNRPRSSAAL